MVSSVPNVFTEYDNSYFFSAMYIQSNGYSILNSISIPGNSTITALILGNIGINTSYFTMGMVKTNDRITSINYTYYIEQYIPFIALMWLVGAGYLVSLKVKRGKN